MSGRRDFLRKIALPGLLGAAAYQRGGEGFGAEPVLREEQEGLVRLRRRAMACHFETFVRADEDGALRAAQEALSLLEPLEQQMSVFRPKSELSEINRRAFHEPVSVEKGLFDLLLLAVALGEQTGGAFDITARPLIRVWANAQAEGRAPSQAEVEAARALVGLRHLSLDAARSQVRFRTEGVELDLGAIGKGHAVDRLVERLRAAGVEHALVHGGFSSIRAIGTAADGEGWTVSVRHPLAKARPDEAPGAGATPRTNDRLPAEAARVRLREQAMSTSAARRPATPAGGGGERHLIDPRTSLAVEGILSATAFAPTAAAAEALSTAFCIMGAENAKLYCASRPEVSGLLFLPGEHGGAVQVVSIGAEHKDVEVLI